MKVRYFKLVALVMAVLMAVCLLGGCKERESDGGTTKGSTTQKSAATTGATTKGTAPYDSDYPIETDVKLIVARFMQSGVQAVFDDYSDSDITKEQARLTGIEVEYIPLLSGEATSVFIASGEYCDVYNFEFNKYPGGEAGLYKDNLIIPVNDVMDYAPNLMNYLRNNPDVDRMVKSPEGIYYTFPYINEATISNYGPFIRKDWLDKLNMEIPKTVDDWTQVLRAFKDNIGASAPITFSYANEILSEVKFLVSAFNTSNGFFLKDGQVVWGPAEPGYREFLSTLANWFAEGLIDPDYASLNREICNNNMISGNSGASCNWASYITQYNTSGRQLDPNYNIVPTPLITRDKNSEAMMAYRAVKYTPGSMGKAIAACSKHPELAARYCDFGYTEEGHMLYNFGKEGLTYSLDSGRIKFTDYYFNPTDGKTTNEVGASWTMLAAGEAYVKDMQREFCKITDDEYGMYLEAYDIWASPNNDKYEVPNIGVMGLSTDDQSRASEIMNEIKNEFYEWCYKFILGELEVNDTNYAEFMRQMKQLNIEEALEIYNRGYNIYKNK